MTDETARRLALQFRALMVGAKPGRLSAQTDEQALDPDPNPWSERKSLIMLVRIWLWCLCIAFIPLGAPFIADTLYPEPPAGADTTAGAASDLLDRIEEAKTRTGADLERAVAAILASEPAAAPDLKDTMIQLIRLEGLQADEEKRRSALDAAAKITPEVRKHAAFRLEALFVAAFALFVCYAVTVLLAQYRLISRHWAALFSRADQANPPQGHAGVVRAPRWILIVSLVLTFLLSLVLICLVDMPGTFADGLNAKGAAFPVVAALTLMPVLTAICLTAFGTRMYARNFPSVTRVEEFYGTVDFEEDTAGKNAGDFWKSMRDTLKAEFEAAVPEDQRMDPVARGTFRSSKKPNPVNASLGGESTAAVIKTLTLPLALMLVAALVVLSLGFDVLEGRVAPTALREAVDRTTEAWLLLLGAGFTISLALIYVLPLARVMPYHASEEELAEQEKSAPAKPKVWQALATRNIKTDTESFDFTLEHLAKSKLADDPDKQDAAAKAARTKAQDIEEFLDRVLAERLGADADKFASVLNASRYGGAFHGIMGDTLTGQFKQILTLLAPALAGTVLSLLG